MSSIDNIIAEAKGLARRHENARAISLADELVRQHPNEMKAWLLRSYLHELAAEYVHAISDLSKAIEINSMEPHLFYNMGRYHFLVDDVEASIQDFSKALELCDFHENDYYREELHFWRAEAFLRLGRKRDAMTDVSSVRDDFKSWTYMLRTKQDLLRDCNS